MVMFMVTLQPSGKKQNLSCRGGFSWLVYEKYFKEINQNQVTLLCIVCKVSSSDFEPRQSYLERFHETFRSGQSEVFLRKGILEICRKFTGEQPCRSMISIKLFCNFIEIALRLGCSPVNLLHIFRTTIYKLLLNV